MDTIYRMYGMVVIRRTYAICFGQDAEQVVSQFVSPVSEIHAKHK